MFRTLTFAVLATATLALSACNTFEGMGRDIQGAGEWTSDSADKVKKKM